MPTTIEELDIPKNKRRFVSKILKKYILGTFISEGGGSIIYSFQLDPKIRADLISSFIAALAMFGEGNVGKIKRIFIEGLDIEMSIFSKHNLIFTMFFKPNMAKMDECQMGMEECIDKFYTMFSEEIEAGKLNQQIYRRFDRTMLKSIMDNLIRMGILKENHLFSHLFSFIKGKKDKV